MCIVCQNVPAVMTGLSGAGLMVRAAIRRTRSSSAGTAPEVTAPAATAPPAASPAGAHAPAGAR